MSAKKISLAVITRNEEVKLRECLDSVPFADEVVVVDSGSTDRTCEIAAAAGAVVYSRPFEDFSSQKNFAMEKTRGEWVLLLDADERLSPGLQSEIQKTIANPRALDGYFLRRDNYLFGGRMRFGANASDWQLRLIRSKKGRFEGVVHERIVLEGKASRLQKPLMHYSTRTLAEYKTKFALFCPLDAERLWKEGKKPTFYHLLIKPLLEFVYFYFVKFGFLDGSRGLLYQVLSTRYLYAKYWRASQLFRERNRASY